MAFAIETKDFLGKMDQAFLANDPSVDEKTREADNVRSIRRAYEGLVSGEMQAFVDLLHEDIVAEIHGPASGPICGKWEGKQNVLEAVGRNFSLFADQNPMLESVVAQGDLVVVFARETGRYLPNDKRYDLHWVQYFHLKNGKVVHFREYMDGDHPWE